MLPNWLRKKYAAAEDGAVTVDMLGLIAAAALLAIGAVSMVSSGSLDFSEALSDHIAAIETSSFNDSSSGSGASKDGNPGNDKAVGGAGEEPDGSSSWGSGAKGKSS